MWGISSFSRARGWQSRGERGRAAILHQYWVRSSAVVASARHAEGHWFDPSRTHQSKVDDASVAQKQSIAFTLRKSGWQNSPDAPSTFNRVVCRPLAHSGERCSYKSEVTGAEPVGPTNNSNGERTRVRSVLAPRILPGALPGFSTNFFLLPPMD